MQQITAEHQTLFDFQQFARTVGLMKSCLARMPGNDIAKMCDQFSAVQPSDVNSWLSNQVTYTNCLHDRKNTKLYKQPRKSQAWFDKRFVDCQPIASGAFGSVAKYFDNTTKQHVAVKRVITNQDAWFFNACKPTTLELVEHEVAVMKALGNTGVTPKLFDSFYIQTTRYAVVYIVMELVEYPSLDNFVDKHAEQTPVVMANVHKAMQAVRQAGYLHTDLHANNILVKPDLSVVIIDFGLANTNHQYLQQRLANDLETVLHAQPNNMEKEQLLTNMLFANLANKVDQIDQTDQTDHTNAAPSDEVKRGTELVKLAKSFSFDFVKLRSLIASLRSMFAELTIDQILECVQANATTVRRRHGNVVVADVTGVASVASVASVADVTGVASVDGVASVNGVADDVESRQLAKHWTELCRLITLVEVEQLPNQSVSGIPVRPAHYLKSYSVVSQSGPNVVCVHERHGAVVVFKNKLLKQNMEHLAAYM